VHPALSRVLAAIDLDELAAAAGELTGTDDLGPDGEARIVETVAAWDDQQALANLLMYPQLIPPDFRAAAIERALGEAGYLRLAAVVGVDRIDRTELAEEHQRRLVRQLVELIAADRGLVAERGSVSIRTLLCTADAPDLVEVLLHPSEQVRHHLTQALFEVAGPAGVAALLDEPGFVRPATRIAVRARLLADGVDLSDASDTQRFPLVLSPVPNLADWRP